METRKGSRSYSFVVEGRPVPKARPRVIRDRRTGRPRVYTPARTKKYEDVVANECLLARQLAGAKRFKGPVRLRIVVKKKLLRVDVEEVDSGVLNTGRPDIDNIVKVVADALTSVAYDDDAQICHLEVIKVT